MLSCLLAERSRPEMLSFSSALRSLGVWRLGICLRCWVKLPEFCRNIQIRFVGTLDLYMAQDQVCQTGSVNRVYVPPR